MPLSWEIVGILRNINLSITYFNLGSGWRGGGGGQATVSRMRILNFKPLGAVRLVDIFELEAL
jgi:hypothetical protein